jgi:hypothetical protein
MSRFSADLTDHAARSLKLSNPPRPAEPCAAAAMWERFYQYQVDLMSLNAVASRWC